MVTKKELEEENKELKDDRSLFKTLMIVLGIAFVLASFVAYHDAHRHYSQINAMGDMICDDAGEGEFLEFNNEKKTIRCAPQKETKKFDGGTIVIGHERGG